MCWIPGYKYFVQIESPLGWNKKKSTARLRFWVFISLTKSQVWSSLLLLSLSSGTEPLFPHFLPWREMHMGEDSGSSPRDWWKCFSPDPIHRPAPCQHWLAAASPAGTPWTQGGSTCQKPSAMNNTYSCPSPTSRSPAVALIPYLWGH